MPPELLTTGEMFLTSVFGLLLSCIGTVIDCGPTRYGTVTHMPPELLTTGQMSLAFHFLHSSCFVCGLSWTVKMGMDVAHYCLECWCHCQV